jgi:hypothetical protein
MLAQAAAQGLPVETYLAHIIERVAGSQVAHFQETATSEEWSRALREWSNSHGWNAAPLSDQAISRESIYAERG